MKTNKISFIACIVLIAISVSLSAQNSVKTAAEAPGWVIEKAKENVAKFKTELKLTPADSTIFTDEFINRTLRNSAAWKTDKTPEEKKEAISASTSEYFDNLKKKISPALYGKYMAFLNRQQK